MMQITGVLAVLGLLSTACGGYLPGQGVLPIGNLRTVDDYPQGYDFSLFPTQVLEVQAGTAAKMGYNDHQIVEFLTNVECLEGRFDTFGAFGFDFNANLTLGGPAPIGGRKANLSEPFEAVMQEIALSEQAHALTTRHAGSSLPCPLVNFTAFDQFLAAAYGLPAGSSLAEIFGAPFDPFQSDETYLTSVLTLEELGATGNKGLALLMSNPVNANILSGLATSATAFAAAERLLLYTIRNNIVPPTNETVQQVFSRISALRDSLDGPQFDDQGLVNTDPRTIAVPDTYINLFPTDVHGLTFSRTPQQAINIYTLGNAQGVGVFFPNGLVGDITTPAGYSVTSPANQDIPAGTLLAGQEASIGNVPPAITASGPSSVTGELSLTQATAGPLEDASASSRGLITAAPQSPYVSQTPQVAIGTPMNGGSTGDYQQCALGTPATTSAAAATAPTASATAG